MPGKMIWFHISAVSIILLAFTLGCAQPKDATPPRTGSISGHVLINNKAAAGVEVAAFNGESLNRRVATAQSKTDSEGFYHLSGLPAANYQVTTFTPNMIAAENGAQSPMGYGYFTSSKTVLLAAGEDVTEIDLKLARGGVITGRVTDAEDKPVVEERVNLQQVTEPGQPQQRLPTQGLLYQTDDRGMYRIYGLPPGRYRVSVGQSASPGNFGSVGGFYVLTYHPDTSDIARATVIDLAAGAEATNVDIKLGRRGETRAITGRVVDAENGLPLSGVPVGIQVVRDQGSSMGSGSVSSTTADGSFTISGVTSGRYGVFLGSDNGNGGSDFYSDPVLVNVADQDVGGIEVKAMRGTSISGSIVPESMELKEFLRQVPGLRVSASTSPADGRMTPTTMRSFGSAPVAADGSFTITGLRPGRAMFQVDSRNGPQRPSLVKIMVGGIGVSQGFEIERQPISGVQLVVVYGTGVISGSVAIQGGTPGDFRPEVICRREGARTSFGGGGAYLDARGRFTLKALAPGSYDCGVQLIPIAPPPGRPVARPPQVPHQTVTVSNDVETEVNFLVDLTPKGVGP
jgi:protocatechuate 3,4-dioxygenase beta subunit